MIKLNGANLTGHQVVKAIRQGLSITLDTVQLEKVSQARDLVEQLLRAGKPIYGINTGFGKLADTLISPSYVAELQRTLI